jgi:hypothetical protein
MPALVKNISYLAISRPKAPVSLMAGGDDTTRQGDQIGRISAYWAIVFFGQSLENYNTGSNFWAVLFPRDK